MEVKIVRHNGQLVIDIDGVLYPPLAFKSFRPNSKNVSEFYHAGVRLYTVLSSGVISGLGIPYSLFGESWIGPGVYDFEPIDRQMDMFIENAPEGYFAPMFQIDTRPWYLKDGKPNSFTNLSQIAGDPQFRKDACDYLRAVIAHCEQKYGDRIWGYFMLGGTTTEWFSDFDYEAPHPIKERAWQRYLGDEGARLPDKALLERSGGHFLSGDEAQIEVFRRFHARLISDLILACAESVQSVIRHEKLLGLYFGYLFELGSPRLHNAGHLDYERVFASPDIDMISSPSSYAYRGLYDPSAFMVPEKSLEARGKLYFLEFDHRTHTTPKVINEPVYAEGGNMIYNSLNFPGSESACKTELELLNLMYRDFIFCEANGAALWWFDMLDGWFRSEGMMKAISHMIDIDRRLMSVKRASAARVAVIAGGEAMYHVRKTSPIASDLLGHIRRTLAEMGAPYDIYSSGDCQRTGALDDYDFYIFLNAYDMARGQLPDSVYRKGKTVLWLYGAGYASGEGSESLTGIAVREVDEDPGRFVWDGAPHDSAGEPHLVIDDDSARVIARFENGAAAAAEKEVNGARSVYAAAYQLPTGFIRALLRESGVKLYSDNPHVYTYANEAFLGVYNATDADAAVALPDGRYTDLVTDELFTAKNGRLTLPRRDMRAYMLVKNND